jgi:hypothetical protein
MVLGVGYSEAIYTSAADAAFAMRSSSSQPASILILMSGNSVIVWMVVAVSCDVQCDGGNEADSSAIYACETFDSLHSLSQTEAVMEQNAGRRGVSFP